MFLFLEYVGFCQILNGLMLSFRVLIQRWMEQFRVDVIDPFKFKKQKSDSYRNNSK